MKYRWQRYATALLGSAAWIAVLVSIRQNVNLATVALLLILLVMFVATWAGRGPSILSSVLALFCFNYFFIPPLHTFSIGQPQNWIAFAVFIISAVLVSELSSMVKSKAEEAERRRVKIEELYHRLQDAFEQASQAETVRRSEKLKTALLDAVTHDLRTPLTSIKASVTALLDQSDSLDDSGRDFLQVINEESDRLNRFVERMMSLAQIEGGQLHLSLRPVSAEDIITNALPRTTRIPLEVTLGPNLPLLEVDPITISQVIHELVTNATRYSTSGRSIQVLADHFADGFVEIAVENEGAPVPEQYRHRVFEKFFRVPGSDNGRSFGMGLAIARGIVEAHGGKIWMENTRDGHGTAVRFTVPCRQRK